MFIVELGSWIALGAACGVAACYLRRGRGIRRPEAVILGMFGAALGGTFGRLLGTDARHGVLALLLALLGAVVLLAVNIGYRGWRGPVDPVPR